MADEKWLGVVIFGVSGAMLFGMWHGRSSAEEEFSDMLRYADLPAQCEDMLRDGADAVNARGDQ